MPTAISIWRDFTWVHESKTLSCIVCIPRGYVHTSFLGHFSYQSSNFVLKKFLTIWPPLSPCTSLSPDRDGHIQSQTFFPWEGFTSPLLRRNTLDWGCSATAVHSQLVPRTCLVRFMVYKDHSVKVKNGLEDTFAFSTYEVMVSWTKVVAVRVKEAYSSWEWRIPCTFDTTYLIISS